MIRSSTLGPAEWQRYRAAHASVYMAWVRPLVMLWAGRVRLRPGGVNRQLLEQSGIEDAQEARVELQAQRLAAAAAAVFLGLVVVPLAPGAVLAVPALAWIGSVVPIRVLARKRARRQAGVRRELPDLIGIVRAFHRAGVPLERTLHLIASQRATFPILGVEIERALKEYGVGSSLDEALSGLSRRTGVPEVALFAGTLAEATRLGVALDDTLLEHERVARAALRNQATAEAAQVSTKLLGITAGIYLPAFVLLIIIPLFDGIVQRAFG